VKSGAVLVTGQGVFDERRFGGLCGWVFDHRCGRWGRLTYTGTFASEEPSHAAVKAKIAAIRKIAINVRLFFDSDARITVVQPCRHSFWNASYIEKRSRIDCAFHEFSRLDATVMLNGY